MTDGPVPELALIRLRARVRVVVSAREVPMDEYQTEEYVEGEIESCELQEFRSDEPPRVVGVYAIDDEDDPSYDVIAEIDGEGDVLWQVTHPSGGDFVRFAGDIDGLEHGGGHFYRLDTDCPIRIRVSAEYLVRGKTWSDVRLDDVSLTPAALERRKRMHDDAEYEYLADLGCSPRNPRTDDEAHRRQSVVLRRIRE